MLIDWKTTHCECSRSTARRCRGRVTLRCHRGRSQSPLGDSILRFLLLSKRDNPQRRACSALSFPPSIPLYGIILEMNLTPRGEAAAGTGHGPASVRSHPWSCIPQPGWHLPARPSLGDAVDTRRAEARWILSTESTGVRCQDGVPCVAVSPDGAAAGGAQPHCLQRPAERRAPPRLFLNVRN